jgi:hypothetical protein
MAKADALLTQVFPYHVRGAVDAIDWIIYTHNTNIQRNIDIVCQYQGGVGSVPIFIEENRRDISELELRFAEVLAFCQ